MTQILEAVQRAGEDLVELEKGPRVGEQSQRECRGAVRFLLHRRGVLGARTRCHGDGGAGHEPDQACGEGASHGVFSLPLELFLVLVCGWAGAGGSEAGKDSSTASS